MSTPEIITFVGLAVLIIGTQLARRPFTLRRFLIPLAAVAAVAYHYLHSIPTAGGDLDFEIGLALAGAICGVLAAMLMRVERDEQTGRIVTQAGVAYAALWIVVFGGRLAFAWAATHLWSHQVAQFSFQHQITGSAAWTTAFVLMALAMVLVRSAIVGARAYMIGRPSPLTSALKS